MYSVVFKGKGKLVSEDRPMPKISDPKDAIVRITLSSICSSDLHILEGHVPRAKNDIIIGHEAVGIVEEVGEQVTELKKGDRVTINVETFCNECFYCEASSTFRVGQQFFKTIAGMYSSFIDDSVPFRQSLERNISQSCVESIVSKKN
ncbi:MAG: alcohol dehydrogenase catalytic domain-containing protein [Candidatus Methanomethylophilaceae archaeon]|nr:alcohol dehydrogenase catalytic domain-containing protein [Candidatus Methanomethylophilaceae archaeon]